MEMHSDQFIRESTVSDLIDVKSFFQGVLKKRLTGAEFLTVLHTSLTRDTNIAAKVHSILLMLVLVYLFIYRCTFVMRT